MLEKFLVNKYCLYLLILVFVFTGCQSIESTIESTTVNTNESAQTLIGKSILNQKVEPLRTAAIGNNLLTNGDFENNLEGWTSCNSADNIKVSPDGQNNTQAISVSADCFYQSVNINPNDNLTLSCNAKVIDEQGWTGFGLTFSDANWNQLSASDSVQISGSTYNDYSLTMNAPANAQYASMWLYSANTALVDNCSLMLETVTSPPPSSQQFTCDVKNNSRWNTIFYMPGYTVEGLEPDYIPTNLQLSLDYQTGTALLSGEIVHFSDTNKKWLVDINYQGRTITAPLNNPSAPTDVEWSYYPTRTGSLKGLGDYAGITLNLVDNPDYEPALQIGLGGNTVHPEFGARHEMYYANPDNISEGIWSEWTYGLACTEITEPPAPPPPPAPPATCVNPISIPDPELAKSIREELNLLNSEAITCEVLEQLFSVSTRANDLTGLEFATNLYYIWSINFSDAGADLSALKDLPNLKNITLTGANNWDIETIKDLDLTTLTTDFVSIPNINGLENLTNLTTLSLTAPANTTNIDLSPLNNLVNLQELKLQNINSNDYSIIGQLTSLTSLFLNPSFEFANSSQIDVTFVSSLTNLENLLLSNTELQNTNLIANLTSLRILSLFPNELTDISGLENLVSLVELTLSSNNITSSELNSLSNLINLQKLILLDNDITDLTVLSNLTSIETLSLGFNAITELAPLRALSNLQNLNIVFTGVCSPNNLAKVENAAFVRELRLRGATISQTPGELTQCSEL